MKEHFVATFSAFSGKIERVLVDAVFMRAHWIELHAIGDSQEPEGHWFTVDPFLLTRPIELVVPGVST